MRGSTMGPLTARLRQGVPYRTFSCLYSELAGAVISCSHIHVLLSGKRPEISVDSLEVLSGEGCVCCA